MIYYEQELYHHGVKGMKWGVRRYQNSDGSLTALGRKHLGIDGGSSIQNKYLNKDGSLNERGLKKAIKNEQKSAKPKSEHFKKLEAGYIADGHSKAAAEELATNRVKTERTLAIIGGVALAGIAAGATYKIAKNRTRNAINSEGMTLKVGDALHRVQTTADNSTDHVFYAVRDKDKMDVRKYKGNLGLARSLGGGGAYKSRIDVSKDIKIPSQKEAESTFKNLLDNDNDFRKKLEDVYENSFAANMLVGLGKSGKSDYDKFNQILVDHDTPGANEVADKFYKALKSKGFGGVLDVNDQRYSGYNAKAPVIVFDTESVVQGTIQKLGAGEIAKNIAVDQFAEKGAKYAAAAGLIGGITAFNKSNDRAIEIEEKYKKKKNDKKRN